MSTHQNPRSPTPSLADGLQALVRLYPWSVLWVLFAMGMALILQGSLIATGAVFFMILAITYHSIRKLHSTTRKGDKL
jgi:hypothetical protein